MGHHFGVADYELDQSNVVLLRWVAEGDGTGRLIVRAAAKGFAGESSGWFDADRVLSFAAAIDQYPLTGEVSLASGYGSSAEDLSEEHVRLAVYPVGRMGQVAIGVHLATASAS